MERPRAFSEASPRDAPAYDYASFPGYRSSLSFYNQQGSFDTQPISRDAHGGHLGHLSRVHHEEAPRIAGQEVSGGYSYTSSYDDISRRYGADGGSYISEVYKGRTFDGTSAYHHEPSSRPSENVGSRFGSSEQALADEQRLVDRYYGNVDSQKSYYDSSSVSGRHDSEYGFSYPSKEYNLHNEQSTSGNHGTAQDSERGALRNDKSSYLLASKYTTAPELYPPSSGASYDWRSAGGLPRAEEEFQWTGFSILSSIGGRELGTLDRAGSYMDSSYKLDTLDRAGSSSRYLGASAYLEQREVDKLSVWNEGVARQAELDAGQKGDALNLLRAQPLANGSKMADTKEALLPMQGGSLLKTANEGMKRKSRWGPVEENEKLVEDPVKKPKRKSRWAAEKSPVKEVKLPDVLKEISAESADVVALRAQLIIINKMLQSGQVIDDLNVKRSPSPEPIFDNFGFRINTREHRAREKLNKERQRIMAKLSETPKPSKIADGKPSKMSKKIYVPVDKYPDYNFVGLIIGPRGHTQKMMEKDSGARIFIRGKGSVKEGVVSAHSLPSDSDDLHVLIEADSEVAINKASEMVKKLLVPVEDGQNELKKAQLRELASLNGTLRGDEVCHECKESGHISKECPVAGGSSTDAVQKGGAPTGSDVCNTCKGPGPKHLSKDCPLLCSTSGPNLPKSGFMGGNKSASHVADTPTTDENDNTLLYVSYLPLSVDDAQLLNLFSPFGHIVHAKVMRHLTTGISKSYGFVKFDNAADAAQATALMNGYRLDGKVLAVKVKSKSEIAN